MVLRIRKAAASESQEKNLFRAHLGAADFVLCVWNISHLVSNRLVANQCPPATAATVWASGLLIAYSRMIQWWAHEPHPLEFTANVEKEARSFLSSCSAAGCRWRSILGRLSTTLGQPDKEQSQCMEDRGWEMKEKQPLHKGFFRYGSQCFPLKRVWAISATCNLENPGGYNLT